jgi:hypothetical protein
MSELEMLLNGMNLENNLEDHADAAAVQAIAKLPASAQAAVVNALKAKRAGSAYIPGESWESLLSKSVADLNINITRESANINTPLSAVLFAVNDLQSNYFGTLSKVPSQAPAGTTLAVTTDPATNDILFTYTAPGPLVDVIRIHAIGNTPMRTFLAGMNNNFMKTRNWLASVSSEDPEVTQAQWSQVLYFGELSSLGKSVNEQLTFRSRQNPSDYRKDLIKVIVQEQKIVPEYAFVLDIVPVAGILVGMDFFISQRDNLNAK